MSPEDKINQLESEVRRLTELLEKLQGNPKYKLPEIAEILDPDISALIAEIRLLRGRVASDFPRDVAEIELINKHAHHVFDRLAEITDERDVALVGLVYQQCFKVSVAALKNLGVRIKVTARDAFEATKAAEKEAKLEKEAERIKTAEQRKLKEQDPEKFQKLTKEQRAFKNMVDVLMTSAGLPRDIAEAMARKQIEAIKPNA